MFIIVCTHTMLRNLITRYMRFLPNSQLMPCNWRAYGDIHDNVSDFSQKLEVRKKEYKTKSEFVSLDCVLAVSFTVQTLKKNF